METTDILGQILTLNNELHDTAGNGDIHRKSEIGDRLATLNVLLGEYEAATFGDANSLEFDYKSSVQKEINRGTGSHASREATAKEKFIDLQKQLVQKENLLKRLTLLRMQTNIVIEQNRQAISNLKRSI
jgi:hypothetical protein